MIGDIGIELELFVLLVLTSLGATLFARFEIETPRWRLLLKWWLLYGLTLGLFPLVGHWVLALPIVGAFGGLVFHLGWCRRNRIDPWSATPRERYYSLRGWTLE